MKRSFLIIPLLFAFSVYAADKIYLYNSPNLKVKINNVSEWSGDLHKETGTLYDPNGYDKNGYDQNGFDINGIHRDTGTIYDPSGFNVNGFNASGFDRQGYDQDGFNAAGWNAAGINKFTGTLYAPNGYDINGFNAAGWNAAGINKFTGTLYAPDGFNINGFNAAGYDRQGYDVNGLGVEDCNLNQAQFASTLENSSCSNGTDYYGYYSYINGSYFPFNFESSAFLDHSGYRYYKRPNQSYNLTDQDNNWHCDGNWIDGSYQWTHFGYYSIWRYPLCRKAIKP